MSIVASSKNNERIYTSRPKIVGEQDYQIGRRTLVKVKKPKKKMILCIILSRIIQYCRKKVDANVEAKLDYDFFWPAQVNKNSILI